MYSILVITTVIRQFDREHSPAVATSTVTIPFDSELEVERAIKNIEEKKSTRPVGVYVEVTKLY